MGSSQRRLLSAEIVNVFDRMQELHVADSGYLTLSLIWRFRQALAATRATELFKITFILRDGSQIPDPLFLIGLSEKLLILSKPRGMNTCLKLVLDSPEVLFFDPLAHFLWREFSLLLFQPIVQIVVYHIFKFLVNFGSLSERLALSDLVSPIEPLLLLWINLGNRRNRAVVVSVSWDR